MPCHVTRTDAYARFQVPGKRSVCPEGPVLRTNLLSVLHRVRRCCPVHLALHHGSFQALVQISVTIYLKGILTKGFDLGKSVAWMMETIQNPSTSVREQKALVNSRVWCQQQSGVLLARAELARVSCFLETDITNATDNVIKATTCKNEAVSSGTCKKILRHGYHKSHTQRS